MAGHGYPATTICKLSGGGEPFRVNPFRMNLAYELAGLTGLTDVSDLYILNFSCLKYRIFTSASISFPKWEEKVGKGFDFVKQDINISSTFLNVV